MAEFNIAKRATPQDDIVRQVRQLIVEEKLPVGSRLPTERELGAKFGVGRSTVREAIRTLVSMGLLDARQGSGLYVQRKAGTAVARSLNLWLELRRTSVAEILEVRGVLERYVAARAATRAGQEDIARLQQQLETIESTKDTEALFDAVAGFHSSLADMSDNPFLASVSTFLIELLLDAQQATFAERDASFWRKRFRRSQANRRAVVEAIASHDEDAAYHAMDAYHRQLEQDFWKDISTPITELTGEYPG